MRAKYYILGSDEFLGTVYEIDNRKIVFMRNPNINIEDGVQFRDFTGMKIEDEEVKQILSDFIFRKPLTESK